MTIHLQLQTFHSSTVQNLHVFIGEIQILDICVSRQQEVPTFDYINAQFTHLIYSVAKSNVNILLAVESILTLTHLFHALTCENVFLFVLLL